MADLYPYRHSASSSSSSSYPPMNLYPHPATSQDPAHNTDDDDPRDDNDPHTRQPDSPKSETKPQATFLTKLYTLLERSENHHMIRWDAAGDHIIVERPEQLALHVLPSVYRQSRFASFSRQLNIYGFMRKVNLRNVDPAIDDPDASTWSHPTLNRHSPPEVVANFKRRVPPRLPKPRKRTDTDTSLNPPRSAATLGPVPLTVPSSVGPSQMAFKGGRARGFSAPGSFTPLAQGGSQWTGGYSRPNLPPLTVPSDSPPNMYHHHHHHHHSMTHGPHDDAPQTAFNPSSYASSGMHPSRESSNVYIPSSYSYPSDHHHWGFQSQINLNTNSPSSLSSLLNPTVPSQSYHPSRPTISTHLSPVASYPSPFSAVPLHNAPSGSSMSPDSRPTTGYSTSYDDSNSMDCSRPGTGNRPLTPASVIGGGRPGSSSKSSVCVNQGTLSIRRGRRHSQAVNPYPSPYDHLGEQRPLTAPSVTDAPLGMTRTKSLIQLPSVESYCFNPAQAEFAYSANGPAIASSSSVDSMDSSWMSGGANPVRPSTGHSTMSAASHSSASGANTPPMDTFEESDIHRFLNQSRPTSASSR